MKRLFYARHGESEMNAADVWAGQIETPLTKNGQAQAKQAGQNLKDQLPHVDVIISSPYSRAYHTAQIIAEEIGYPVDSIVRNELLVERNFGVLEGTSSANYFDEHTFEDIDKTEGAETVAQLHDRAVKALAYIESRPEDNILIVAHGAFGRALRRVINKQPHTHEYIEEHRQKLRLGNAEIVELI